MSTSDKVRQKHNEPSQPHYLFVDDDFLILTLMKSFFKREANVSLANDGHEALEKIAGQHFDAIVADVDMPTLNGIGLFKILSAMDSSIYKKFLFCSGIFSPELSQICTEHQVRFISKPISMTALQVELDAVINY